MTLRNEKSMMDRDRQTESHETSALVPRPPRAVERIDTGAKRVLEVMVAETLAIAQKQLTPVSTRPTQADLEDWYQQGEKHYRGAEAPQNYAEAVKWYRKAAEQNHARAQVCLGLCYTCGVGVPEDDTEAAKWYRRAAEQGHAGAQFSLGWCNAEGRGVPKDRVEASKWFRLASEQGHKEAAKTRASLNVVLSPQELQEAERRINEFKETHKQT
jgi:hypothetical protein